ncbi:MBL fold metallo-hydrolase [Brevibacterium sp. UCMA 11752]|uniref:MBL fold metallo-hydrolase n=1 Tax=Brevibacterium sp. UCMA 11752 TaxID=2745946 RepID=UPI001F32D0F3|nr:MBL fold metallo-hydrolase [Brevibacterium sp. UCMA 11752]MCF2587114.1 MBL fold metallo-hydrolase [Brevibacterium sp. UCMA 11752]
MKMTQVRNATMVMSYDDATVLIDPMLGAKGSMPPFPCATGDTSRNPLVDLVVSLDELLTPDVIVVTHTHADHWDPAAAALLPRHTPILAQHAEDAALIADEGFTDVRILESTTTVAGVEFTRAGGQHGSDEILESMPDIGEVMGVVLRHDDDPVVYIAGDTIMTDEVRRNLAEVAPDVVVLNTGEAVPSTLGPIIMGPKDVVEVAGLAPQAKVVASHLEALNHCPATREDVRAAASAHAITDRVLVPEDGEVLRF